MTVKFTYHQDPSHGWVEVSLKILKEINANLSKISSFSYYRSLTTGKVLYLEEDGDVLVLIEALKENGIEFEFDEVHTNHDSWIRGLQHWAGVTR